MKKFTVAKSFTFDDIEISNPTQDETGRIEVNPIEYYGDTFLNWKENIKKHSLFVPSEEIGAYITVDNGILYTAPMCNDGSIDESSIGEVEWVEESGGQSFLDTVNILFDTKFVFCPDNTNSRLDYILNC